MIYDCFTFFNELDLLELRLETLTGVVDRFVLVESTRTFTNQEKPLWYAENKTRFARFADRIEHVIVEDNPEGSDPWRREYFQRDAIARGLQSTGPDDLVFVSDLDEIWNPAQLAPIKAAATAGKIVVCEQHNCYYFVNTSNGYWHGTRAVRAVALKQLPPSRLRHSAGTIIPDGGWHISFAGGPEAVLQKLRAYSHQEYNTPAYANADRVAAAMATGADLFSRAGSRSRLLSPRELPPVIQNAPDRFRWLLADKLVSTPEFHENWYHMGKIRALLSAFEHVRDLSGRVIEIGCWEGKSTSFLTRACWPNVLQAVDTWAGNQDEAADHPSAIAARERDVSAAFLRNMFVLTRGHFQAHRIRSMDYLAADRSPVKFCHLDASHDYRSVKAEIEAVLPLVVSGGILCGDDFENASLQNPTPGMDGGVERAVRELLPGFRNDGNFWWWRKGVETPSLGGRLARLRRRFAPAELKRLVASRAEAITPSLFNAARDWWWRRQARRRMKRQALEKAAQFQVTGAI